MVLDGADQAQYRDQDQDDAARQDAADDGQIGDNGGRPAVHADADHQEADQLPNDGEGNTVNTHTEQSVRVQLTKGGRTHARN